MAAAKKRMLPAAADFFLKTAAAARDVHKSLARKLLIVMSWDSLSDTCARSQALPPLRGPTVE